MDTLKMKELARYAIRNSRGSFLVDLLARACTVYLRAYENAHCWDLSGNGEGFVLDALGQVIRKPVIFDVGAHSGSWSIEATKRLQGADLHLFELSPKNATALRDNSQPQWRINCEGLSDAAGEVQIREYTHSTVYTNIDGLVLPQFPFSLVSSRVRTGDDYVDEFHLSTIDLLKIDTEGHDLRVLKGFSRTLADGCVRVIQFEYGETSAASRTFLADFYDLLQPLGYDIGRLYPRGVEFRSYDVARDERFFMGNYIAVRRDQVDLRALLTARDRRDIIRDAARRLTEAVATLR